MQHGDRRHHRELGLVIVDYERPPFTLSIIRLMLRAEVLHRGYPWLSSAPRYKSKVKKCITDGPDLLRAKRGPPYRKVQLLHNEGNSTVEVRMPLVKQGEVQRGRPFCLTGNDHLISAVQGGCSYTRICNDKAEAVRSGDRNLSPAVSKRYNAERLGVRSNLNPARHRRRSLYVDPSNFLVAPKYDESDGMLLAALYRVAADR